MNKHLGREAEMSALASSAVLFIIMIILNINWLTAAGVSLFFCINFSISRSVSTIFDIFIIRLFVFILISVSMPIFIYMFMADWTDLSQRFLGKQTFDNGSISMHGLLLGIFSFGAISLFMLIIANIYEKLEGMRKDA